MDGNRRAGAGDGRRSRVVIAAVVLISVAVALAPKWWGGGGRGDTMRHALQEVLGECRAGYDSATTAADTARVDSMIPPLNGVARPGDPPCGKYRQKRMFRR